MAPVPPQACPISTPTFYPSASDVRALPPPATAKWANRFWACAPHQTWKTVKKRKWTHLRPAPSQPGNPPPLPPGTGLTSSPNFLVATRQCLKITLLQRVPHAPHSNGNIKPLQYMYTASPIIRIWCSTSPPLLKKSSTTAKPFQMIQLKSMFTLPTPTAG